MIQIYTEPHRWLYGGVFEVVGRRREPQTFSYDVELREEILPGCVGRLKVRLIGAPAAGVPRRYAHLRRNGEHDAMWVARWDRAAPGKQLDRDLKLTPRRVPHQAVAGWQVTDRNLRCLRPSLEPPTTADSTDACCGGSSGARSGANISLRSAFAG
jgi:hypothetical protein